MLLPISPPAMPVAITGVPSRLRARAIVTPCPPGSVTPLEARWRRPTRKLGTTSARSIAVFSVTVVIIPCSP